MRIDSKLNVKKPAWDVLRILQRRLRELPENLERKVLQTGTAAWYNGRERGISLVVQKRQQSTENLVIVWTECRNSDQIVVWAWRPKHISINPPSYEDTGFDAVYKHGTYFDYNKQWTAAQYINSVIETYLREA